MVSRALPQAPSEDEISQVIDFASLNSGEDRAMVIQALKDNGRNVEAVVMQYFDNPESFRQKFTQVWNDNMFSADRDGSANQNGVSFHIETLGSDDAIQGVTPPPDAYRPTAPSRPPSRSNNRSPLRPIVDWAANDAAANEEHLQRALRESAQEAGIGLAHEDSENVNPQALSTPVFGPANRVNYDPENWAMVPSAPLVKSAPAIPIASARKRSLGAPAFLCQDGSNIGVHGLGGLLTVLHGIPLARNTLLKMGTPATSYGFDTEWWRGQEILPPHALAHLQAGELQWERRENSAVEVEEEIHRLMAFLDSTERSYGTADVLTNLLASPQGGPEAHFYEFIRNKDESTPLRHSATIVPVFDDAVEGEEIPLGLLEMSHQGYEWRGVKTLYEALDLTMWNDAFIRELDKDSKMAMFTGMGEVLAIKVGKDGPETCFEIPEKLYLDKYQSARKAEARRISVAWCQVKGAVSRVVQEEAELYEWQDDLDNLRFDRKQMIHRANTQWQTFGRYLDSLGRFREMEQSNFDTNKYPDYRAAPCVRTMEDEVNHETVEDVMKLTERIVSDIDEISSTLRARLAQLQTKQRFLGRLLTQPNKADRPKPMTCKEFMLRGIVTPSNVTYVCQRAQGDLIEMEAEPRQSDQWWRLAYDFYEAQPVKTEKISLDRVLEDVWKETKTPLMVYATQTAMNATHAPLPTSLQSFARADNKAFQQEILQEAASINESKTPASLADPVSPFKRKHRADSACSMDSNRASVGSAGERNGFDNAIEDGEFFSHPLTAPSTPVDMEMSMQMGEALETTRQETAAWAPSPVSGFRVDQTTSMEASRKFGGWQEREGW